MREVHLEEWIRRELVNSEAWLPVKWACQVHRRRGALLPSDDSVSSGEKSELQTVRRFIAWLCHHGA